MSLSISVFGLGYVGSVSAACFASMGHRVIGVDVNPAKVEMMEGGRSPIIEASMNELVAEGQSGLPASRHQWTRLRRCWSPMFRLYAWARPACAMGSWI